MAKTMTLNCLNCWSIALLAIPSPLVSQVTTAQYDNARTGAYTSEHTLTPRNVNATQFGRTNVIHVDGDVYAQVLELPKVTIPGKGARDVIFVATEHNSVYAFDAASPVQPLWHVSLSKFTPGATPLSSRAVECPFIRPEVGITSTPVIDAATNTIYVLARTGEDGREVQRLFALNVATGAERRGSPVEIRATVEGKGTGSGNGVITFDPLRENPRAALLLVGNNVVLSWASSCDVGPYHGWIMAYDAHTLRQTAVLNVTPNGTEGGIWQGDAGIAADREGRIYAATGNGTFSAGSGGHDYGDTILQLAIKGETLEVTDYFTPYDERVLENQDGDLGSGGPILLPDQPGAHAHLLFMGGKGEEAYLVDRDHMGKFDPATNRGALQIIRSPGMIFGASATWNGHVYTLWSGDVIKDFALRNGLLTPAPVARGFQKFTDPGAAPAVSANGTRDGIVWVVETRTWRGDDKPAVLHAYDAANVARELYSSNTHSDRDAAGVALRFAMPAIVNGKVYVGAKREVDVYGLIAPRKTS